MGAFEDQFEADHSFFRSRCVMCRSHANPTWRDDTLLPDRLLTHQSGSGAQPAHQGEREHVLLSCTVTLLTHHPPHWRTKCINLQNKCSCSNKSHTLSDNHQTPHKHSRIQPTLLGLLACRTTNHHSMNQR